MKGLKRARRTIRVSRAKIKEHRAQRSAKRGKRVIRVDAAKVQEERKPSFFRFAGSSMLCTGVDQLLAAQIFYVLKKPLGNDIFLRILLANVCARCVSLTLNFLLNRRLVFPASMEDSEEEVSTKRGSVERLVVLSASILGLSTLGVFLVTSHTGIEEWQAKLLVDFCLFFLNYAGQRMWVFRTEVRVPVSRLKRRG